MSGTTPDVAKLIRLPRSSMTLDVLSPTPRPDHSAGPRPVDAALSAMDRALALMQSALAEEPSAEECERALAGLERHGRRVSAVRMRVVAIAGRSAVAQDAGFASTESWV